MENQPGRGGAASLHAATLSKPGSGSLALPGARDTSTPLGGLTTMTPEAYYA